MAQLESAATSGISSSQQQQLQQQQQQQTVASPLAHPSLGMEGRNLPQPVLANQGKQATIHDFLSLCGTGASSTSAVTVSNNGSQQSVTTQDLLQPLQKSLNPGSSSLLPNGFVISASKPYDPSAGQQSNYAFGNGSFELRDNFQSNYRSANISFGAKGHVPHAIPLTKHWQQQQPQEVSDGNKRLARIPSEEDDDEDDESFDHGYSARKEGRYQKCEQQLEGRNADSKGATPRSKHSATEQRRRSKINDRFQMLRQLLPNADQKRDKASFLLEVIEHIQMLHEKVKKYEGPEHRVPHQERTKVLSWDRNSGQQDLTYVSTHDTKEAPDTNGYMRSRLSPLRVISEDGIANSELMCSVVHASTLQGAQVCLSNYESKPLISKPIPLTFSQPPATSTLEQAPNPVYQTEGQIMFGQLLRQEEQAAIKARGLVSNKPEVIMPHFQQSRNMLISQESSQVAEHNFQRLSRNNEQNLAILNFRRLEDEVEGRVKVSQLTDISATSKESGKDVNRPAYGFDGKTVNGVMDGSKAEQRSEVSTNDQEANPAVLGGMINISSVYSQGLLDTLTRALQSSGVDLTQATISVQIDLGKPEGSTAPSSNQMVSLHTGALPFQNKETVSSQEAEHPQKRLKIEAD